MASTDAARFGLDGGNPVIRHRYTADPTAIVHGGTRSSHMPG